MPTRRESRSSTCRAAALATLFFAAVPATAGESIWIEGEEPARSTFEKHGWYDAVDKKVLSAGDWLSHYGPRPGEATWEFEVRKAGRYTVLVRCNDLRVTQHWKLDSDDWALCDLESDPRERITVSPKPDHRRIAWHRLGKVHLRTGRHTISFRLTSRIRNHGGIDCLVLTDFPFVPSGTRKPRAATTEEAGPSDWFEFHPGRDPFSTESRTDVSRLLHRPAGKLGFVRRDGPRLVAGGREIRFWGCGANIQPRRSREWQERRARYLAKHGVNVVRQHTVEHHLGLPRRDPRTGEPAFDSERLDEWDWWFATLKRHGIYMAWSMFYPHSVRRDEGYDLFDDLPAGRDGDVRTTSGVVNVERALQDSQWRYLELLLRHRNPYTGLRYVDDPALAVMEVHNEDCVFWHAPLNELASGEKFPKHGERLRERWAGWLAKRYRSDEKLREAWGEGMREDDSIHNPRMAIYGAWEMQADGPSRRPRERRRMGDFIRFLAEEQRGFYERRERRLRDLGFRGVTVTTAWKAGGPAADAANLWADDAMDMIDRHNYFGGGAGRHRIEKGRVNADSHLSRPGGGLLTIGLYQVEDKPFSVTEWTQMPPNPWKAEAAPLLAFYGMGLQGWDASFHFLSSHNRLEGGWPDRSWYATDTPHYIGQFPALAIAVHGGHIREAPIAVARRLGLDRIFAGVDAVRQDLTGGDRDRKELRSGAKTPRELLAVGRVTLKISDDAGDSRTEDWRTFWDRERQVIRSVTGELKWDYGKRIVTVGTPKTQAVIGFAGGTRQVLPAVEVDVRTAFVSLIFTSLDDATLEESKQVLVTAMARDRQTGSRSTDDGRELVEVGGPPLLMEPVEADIRFPGAPARRVRALDVHGTPTDREVPVRDNGFTIDGRYRAFYYEVER